MACAGLMLPKAAGYNDSPYVFDCGKRDDFLINGTRCLDGETDPYAMRLHLALLTSGVDDMRWCPTH